MGKVIPFDWKARFANSRAETSRLKIKLRMLDQAIREEFQKEMQATLAGHGHYTLKELADFKVKMDQEELWEDDNTF